MDFGGPGLEYATLEGGVWRVEEVGTGPIMYAEGLSMTFASGGEAHISYHNTLERSLYHGTRREGTWRLTRVDSGPDAGLFSSIALTNDGTPQISYIRMTAAGAEIRVGAFRFRTARTQRFSPEMRFSVPSRETRWKWRT